jgi:hypothetical protein
MMQSKKSVAMPKNRLPLIFFSNKIIFGFRRIPMCNFPCSRPENGLEDDSGTAASQTNP